MMHSMARSLTAVIKQNSRDLRSPRGPGGSLWCQNSSPGPFPHFGIILLVDTPRDTFKGDHQVDVKWLPSLPQSADLNNTGLLWNVLECRVRSGFPPPSSLKAFPLQRRRVNIQLLTVHNLEGSVPWGSKRPLKGGPTSLLGTWCSNTVQDFHSQK